MVCSVNLSQCIAAPKNLKWPEYRWYTTVYMATKCVYIIHGVSLVAMKPIAIADVVHCFDRAAVFGRFLSFEFIVDKRQTKFGG